MFLFVIQLLAEALKSSSVTLEDSLVSKVWRDFEDFSGGCQRFVVVPSTESKDCSDSKSLFS